MRLVQNLRRYLTLGIAALALLVAVAALVIALRGRRENGGGLGADVWRVLAPAPDLPEGWSQTTGAVQPGPPGPSAFVNLRGPEKLTGLVSISPLGTETRAARDYLQALRASSTALGQELFDVPPLGDEATGQQQAFGPLISSSPAQDAAFTTYRSTVVWRHGMLVAVVSISDIPSGLTPDGQRDTAAPVDPAIVIELARRYDARLAGMVR